MFSDDCSKSVSTYSPVITRRPTVPHHHHHSDAIQHATPPFLNLHHQHHPYSTSSLNQTYTSSEVYFPQPAHFSAHSHSFTDLSYPHEGKTSDSIRSVSYQGSVHSDNDTGHTLSLFELARTPTDDVDSINSKKKSISPHSSFICSPLSLASMATSLSPHSPSRSRSHRGSSDDRPDATARRSISAESSATSDVPALYHERSDSNSLSVPSSVSEGPDSPPANQSHHHPNHAPASAPPAPDLQSQLLESVCHLRADLAKTNDVIRCQQLVDAFLVQCGLGAALSEETAAELKLWRRRRRIGREESGRDS